MAVDEMIQGQREIWQADTKYIARRNFAHRARTLVRDIFSLEEIEGYDVSHHQNDAQDDNAIPFALLKSLGHEFTIIKATEGTSFQDGYWTQNWQEAVAAGLRVCGYHFFRSNLGGSQQGEYALNNFLPLVQAVGYKPILFLDVESRDGVGNTVRSNRFVAMVNYLLNAGVQVGVYSSPGFWDANMDHSVVAGVLPRIWQWIAHWTSGSTPLQPRQWTSDRIRFWQKGISGVHSWLPAPPVGFSGNVDYNVFIGTSGELDEVLQVPPPPSGCDCETIEARLSALEADLADLVVDQERQDENADQLDASIAEISSLIDAVRDAWQQSE